MEDIFSLLKSRLPPKASFALRYAKSNVVDAEMAELARFVKAIGGPGSCALDVGANSGLYSMVLARHVGRVLSFEPHPDCAAYMREVLPPNCAVIEAAASDKPGTAILRVPISRGALQTTRSTISPRNAFDGLDVSGTEEIEVKSGPLDALVTSELREGRPITVVKIDVEGHEFPVLSGARGLLEIFRPGIYVELENRHGTNTADALDLLDRLDYEVVRRQGERYVAARRLGRAGWRAGVRAEAAKPLDSVNVMLLPREKVLTD